MRTKTLILSAMIGVAGVASSFAQNVYSVNVVGYINLTLSNKFSLIANQLDNGTGNYVTNLFAGVPVGTFIYKYNGTAYDSLQWRLISPPANYGWSPAANISMRCEPGEGVFVQKPATPTTPINITFVGEVRQGLLTNDVIGGYDIYSTIVPQAGPLVDPLTHNYVQALNDVVYQYTGVAYETRTWKNGPPPTFTPRWEPVLLGAPSVKVGEAFFIKSATVGVKKWIRDFKIN